MDLCIQGFHAWRPIASAIIAVPRLGPAKAVTFTAPLIRAVGAYGRLCGGNSAHSVLVLGGDGLAARELLRQPGVDKIVQVELDPAVIELACTTMRSANGGSLDNPRVHVITDDAMTWLRGPQHGSFDAVIVDLPDPDTPVLGRLYSTEFYALVSRALAPGG